MIASKTLLVFALVSLLNSCAHQLEGTNTGMSLPFPNLLLWSKNVNAIRWENSSFRESVVNLEESGGNYILQVKNIRNDFEGKKQFRESIEILKRYFSQETDPYNGPGAMKSYCGIETLSNKSLRISIGAYGISAYTCFDLNPKYLNQIDFLECNKSGALFIIKLFSPFSLKRNDMPIATCL